MGEGNEDKRTVDVREKCKGKQLTDKEHSPKKKKSTGGILAEEGPVTIGAIAPHQRR
jgi:hypothetical protein